MKNSSLGTDLELSRLEVKHTELERELNNVKAAIDRRKTILVQIPDVISQKKQELLARVKESRTIRGSLENAPGTVEEYEHKVAEANAIRLAIFKSHSGCFELVIHRLTYMSCVRCSSL